MVLDLGLAGHDSIERGASSISNWVPKLPNRRVLKRTIDRCDVQPNLGMIHLRIPCQQTVHNRNADA